MTASPTDTDQIFAPLPAIADLAAALPLVQAPGQDILWKIQWCRDVLFLYDRQKTAPDPELRRLAPVAASVIQQTAATRPAPPEAIYMLGILESTGSIPEQIPHNPRNAFRDFEAAARGGHHVAWFNLGRDYENFGNNDKARECFDRGIKHGNAPNCLYRMGMAHLLGQLGLAPSPEIAMSLLYQAATRATLENPQPAYAFALILLAEFTAADIPDPFLQRYIPPQSSRSVEARIYLERAGYLHFGPAQYKLGHVHEFAQEPFPFDPVLSVQWYNAAALQGEAEAEMALSKWFLVGAEGYFEKDEDMSLVFAEKAASKGLPAAEFALGYYFEVGIGPLKKDADQARAWYTKAHEHGAPEAAERLQALNQSVPQTLGREEHATVMEDKLVRKQTSAKQRAMARQAEGGPPREAPEERQNGERIIKHIRKNTIERIDNSAYANMSRYNLSDAGTVPPPINQHVDPRSAPPTVQSFPDLRHVGSVPNGRVGPPGQQRPDMGSRIHSASSVPQIAQVQQVSQSVPSSPSPSRRPTTFAEMGIPSAKVAEKQDCVIM